MQKENNKTEKNERISDIFWFSFALFVMAVLVVTTIILTNTNKDKKNTIENNNVNVIENVIEV